MKKIIFLCLLALSVNAVLIQTIMTDSSLIKNVIRIGILMFAVFYMLINKQPISKVLFLLIIASSISLLLGKNIDQLSFIFIFIFIHSLFLLDGKNVEKYLLWSSVLSFSLVFIFLGLGLTDNMILDFRNRMTFGTKGVPFFFNLVYGTFALLVIYALKYFIRFKWLTVLASMGGATYFFIMTDARGGYVSFLAFLVLLVIIPLFSRLQIFRYVVALIPLIAVGLSFYIASLHNSIEANQLLSYRPILLNTFYENISPFDVLFSSSVKALDTISIVDNSYVHLMVGGGIVIASMVAYLFFKAILRMFHHKKHIEIAFIVATCLYFNTESIMVRVENMFVIYFWYLIIKYSLTKVEPETETVKEKVQKRRLFKRYKIVW